MALSLSFSPGFQCASATSFPPSAASSSLTAPVFVKQYPHTVEMVQKFQSSSQEIKQNTVLESMGLTPKVARVLRKVLKGGNAPEGGQKRPKFDALKSEFEFRMNLFESELSHQTPSHILEDLVLSSKCVSEDTIKAATLEIAPPAQQNSPVEPPRCPDDLGITRVKVAKDGTVTSDGDSFRCAPVSLSRKEIQKCISYMRSDTFKKALKKIGVHNHIPLSTKGIYAIRLEASNYSELAKVKGVPSKLVEIFKKLDSISQCPIASDKLWVSTITLFDPQASSFVSLPHAHGKALKGNTYTFSLSLDGAAQATQMVNPGSVLAKGPRRDIGEKTYNIKSATYSSLEGICGFNGASPHQGPLAPSDTPRVHFSVSDVVKTSVEMFQLK